MRMSILRFCILGFCIACVLGTWYAGDSKGHVLAEDGFHNLAGWEFPGDKALALSICVLRGDAKTPVH